MRESEGLKLSIRKPSKIGVNPYTGRIRNVREDVKSIATYKLLISRSSVRSRDSPPFKSMGYEIILIAHFCYVLAMYSTAVKEFQYLSPHVIDNLSFTVL